jgi:hypothetical protein
MDTIDPGVTGRRTRRPLWTSRVVCEYFGGVVPRSLHRWKNDPTLGFPQPTVINKRDYYDPQEIEDFALRLRAIADHEAKKAAESKPAVEPQPKTKVKAAKPKLIPAEKPARRRLQKDRAAASAEHENTTS